MLINFDLKQIEIVVLQILSGDLHLKKLLQDGIDLYRYFASVMYSKDMHEVTKEERDSLKAPVLGISYGRGAKALSAESGKSVEWCEEFVNRFYEEFPLVKVLHDRWIEEVERTGQLRLQTGVVIKFNKYIWNNKTQKKEKSTAWNAKYWTPEIKNYPVQHTAFVILSTFVAMFFRHKAIYKREKYLLINTVHDSLMLDVRPEYIEEAKNDLKEVLDMLPDTMYNMLEIKIDVPVLAEITEGISWYEV